MFNQCALVGSLHNCKNEHWLVKNSRSGRFSVLDCVKSISFVELKSLSSGMLIVTVKLVTKGRQSKHTRNYEPRIFVKPN
jgi:hypothetical protein